MKKKLQVLQYLTASLCTVNVAVIVFNNDNKPNLTNIQKVKLPYNLNDIIPTLFDNDKITLDSQTAQLQENIYKALFSTAKKYYGTIDEFKNDKTISLKILVKNEVIICSTRTLQQVLAEHYGQEEQYQISIKLNIIAANSFFKAEEQQITYAFKNNKINTASGTFVLWQIPGLPKNRLYSKLATNNNFLVTTFANIIYIIKNTKVVPYSLALPEDVIINDLAIDSSNNIYVATNKGVFKKNAFESTFELITGIDNSNNDEVKVLAINNNSKMLYAGTKQGKLYTTKIDKQQTKFSNDLDFTQLNKMEIMKIVIQQDDTDKNGKVYVATSQKVFCFDQEVNTWNHVAPELSNITDLAIHSSNNVIYVSTKTGVYVAKIENNNFSILIRVKNIVHIMINEPLKKLYFTNKNNDVFYYDLSKTNIFLIKGINDIIKDIILYQNKVYIIAQKKNDITLFYEYNYILKSIL